MVAASAEFANPAHGNPTMSLFSRFLGRRKIGGVAGRMLVANPDLTSPLSLQVLFAEPYRLDADRLVRALKSYHASMSEARCEIDAELGQEGTLLGMIGWGQHVVRLVGFNAPMPVAAVETCVAPSHYPKELKDRARAHRAHVILYYAGYEASPFDRYVALAAAAGVLGRLGALVVLNESARTSCPVAVLAGADAEGDVMEFLRAFPLLLLYCGFVKLDVEGVAGVWMRTFGAPLIELPDLAAHARGHEEGQRYFDMFENIFGYLRGPGSRLALGDTMQIGEQDYVRFRAPSKDEDFLADGGELLVADTIGAQDINR